jgi:hypothetical protein
MLLFFSSTIDTFTTDAVSFRAIHGKLSRRVEASRVSLCNAVGGKHSRPCRLLMQIDNVVFTTTWIFAWSISCNSSSSTTTSHSSTRSSCQSSPSSMVAAPSNASKRRALPTLHYIQKTSEKLPLIRIIPGWPLVLCLGCDFRAGLEPDMMMMKCNNVRHLSRRAAH